MEHFKKFRAKGSAVVEMSYIIPMFLLIFVTVVHLIFCYYDKAVLNGAASETAVFAAQLERKKGTEQTNMEQFFIDRVRGKLIYMRMPSVTVEKNKSKITVKAETQRSFMKISISQTAVIPEPEEKIRWMKR